MKQPTSSHVFFLRAVQLYIVSVMSIHHSVELWHPNMSSRVIADWPVLRRTIPVAWGTSVAALNHIETHFEQKKGRKGPALPTRGRNNEISRSPDQGEREDQSRGE